MYETKITRTLEENPGAREVRTRVFVEEQGYQNEFDSHDADAVHLCLYDGGRGVATARAYRHSEDGVYVLGRGAVLPAFRGRGLGAREIRLSSQLHAMKMYAALGYQPEGETIYDEGQPHRMMRKVLA